MESWSSEFHLRFEIKLIWSECLREKQTPNIILLWIDLKWPSPTSVSSFFNVVTKNVANISLVNPVLGHWQLLLLENKCLKILLALKTQVRHNLQHWFELRSFLWTMFAYKPGPATRLVLSKHLYPIVRNCVRKHKYENSNSPYSKFKNKVSLEHLAQKCE